MARRGPHRIAHLAHAWTAPDLGYLLLGANAWLDENCAHADPQVMSGLVHEWSMREPYTAGGNGASNPTISENAQ